MHRGFCAFTLLVCTTALPLVAVSEEAPPRQLAPREAAALIAARAAADVFSWHWLAELCDTIGPRLAGSEELDLAARFAVRSFREAGFDAVYTEPVTVPHWVRGSESARLTAPVDQPLQILGLGGSVGTPPTGIEAAVMVVSSFDELAARGAEAAGRIVLFDPPWTGYGEAAAYRTGAASAAARHGAVAVLVRSPTGRSLATPHTGVMYYSDDAPRIPAAAVTVEDAGRLRRLAIAGSPPRVALLMGARSLPERQQDTVIAEVRGHSRPDEIVLVGCHLDSWDVGTGAHDDGAGCAIVAGAARLLLDPGLRPRRTVRVVLFASEEYGAHAGRAYAEAHADELEKHVAALESDSGCYPPDGFSVRASDAVIAHLTQLAAPLDGLGASSIRPGWAGVDIGPIVELGVPGIGHRTANDHYFDIHHSPADTLDKIDPEQLEANVAAVATLVRAIADDPISLRELAAPDTSGGGE